MGALTTSTINKVLDHLNGVASYTPTGPLKARLMTVNGSAASAGTEVTGGSYAPQTITLGAASSGSASNSGLLTYSAMPACTVVGVEIWDSAGTPVRLWWGALTASRNLLANDDFFLPIGSIVEQLT